MSPAEADECEVWQLAALLNVDTTTEPVSDFDRLAARVAAEKQKRGLPEHAQDDADDSDEDVDAEPVEKPVAVDMTAQIMRSMGIRTR